VISIALAMLLRFSAHRASACTFRGVAEIMSTRHGRMLISIAKSIVRVLAVGTLLLWFAPGLRNGLAGWHLSRLALLGGALEPGGGQTRLRVHGRAERDRGRAEVIGRADGRHAAGPRESYRRALLQDDATVTFAASERLFFE